MNNYDTSYNKCDWCYIRLQSCDDKMITEEKLIQISDYYSIGSSNVDMQRQLHGNILHKAKRYVTRIIMDVMNVIIHRAIERSFLGCA